jgi:uncharacterized membrane protein
MDINRPATTSPGFNMAGISQNTMMMVLIALVIIILLIMLFQSSSGGNNEARAAYVNPLNATMRANPFINPAQRNML